jgi:hypothetical protein
VATRLGPVAISLSTHCQSTPLSKRFECLLPSTFYERGHLCGVISTCMPGHQSEDEHGSYVTSLSPMLGITVDVPGRRLPSGNYAARGLARRNVIAARDWKRVVLQYDDQREVTGVHLRHP